MQAIVGRVAHTATALASHIHLPHLDWFHLQHAKSDVAAMLTPGGHKSRPVGSIINLLNGTLGAGILAMPLMFSLMGWVLGLLVLAATSVLGVLTTTAMVYVGIAENTKSYHMTVKTTLGRWPFIAFQLLLIFGALGCLLAFFILLGDFTDDVSGMLTSSSSSQRRPVVVIISLVLVLPLCLLRKLSSLWFTGSMAMAFVAFFVAASLLKTAHPPTSIALSSVRAVDTTAASFFRAVPLAVFAFAAHSVVYPLFNEMKTCTLSAFIQVSAWTFSIVFVLYSVAG